MIEFWEIEALTTILRMDLDPFELLDFREFRCLDDATQEEFSSHGLGGGKPLNLGGSIRIELPENFGLNIFESYSLIVTPEIAATFRELAAGDVQLFPIAHGQNTRAFYFVIPTKSFDCLDEKRAGTQYDEHGVPYAVNHYYVRPDSVPPDVNAFTGTFLRGTFIVREKLRGELLRRHNLSGATFEPAS